MSTIQKLTQTEFAEFAPLMANAYPGLNIVSPRDIDKLRYRLVEQSEDPAINFYGLYQHSQLLGGMRLNDFIMQCRSCKVRAGGVGSVAVHLLHKKEKVAKKLITFFINHYRHQKVPILLLYPFRPDFYRRMGFGYGPKINQYRFKPASLPADPATKGNLVFLKSFDKEALRACYHRVMNQSHGLLAKSNFEVNQIFSNSKNKVVAYTVNNQVRGYIIFQFNSNRPDNILLNDIHLSELIYETREALIGLLTFLHSQADQINTIYFNSHDDGFHYLLADPRNGTDNLNILCHESNTQSVGLMYRVIDVPGLFSDLADHNFGGQTCTLKLTIADSFYSDNAGSTIVTFANGYATITHQRNYDVEIKLDIADFSSLLMGCISFQQLYDYNLAGISDIGFVDTVNHLFSASQKPRCTTTF